MKRFFKIFLVCALSVVLLLVSVVGVSAYSGSQYELFGGIEFDNVKSGIAGDVTGGDVDFPGKYVSYSVYENKQYFALRLRNPDGSNFIANAWRYYSFDLILPKSNKTFDLTIHCRNYETGSAGTVFSTDRSYVRTKDTIGSISVEHFEQEGNFLYQDMIMSVSNVPGGTRISFKVYFHDYTGNVAKNQYIFLFGIGSFAEHSDLYAPPTIGNDVGKLEDAEGELNGKTSDGVGTAVSYFSNLGGIVKRFSPALLAIKGCVDYIVKGSILEFVLIISLSLGLLGFFMNLGSRPRSSRPPDVKVNSNSPTKTKSIEHGEDVKRLGSGNG